MSTLTKKKNGSLFPELVTDFFDPERFFTPSIFDIDRTMNRFSRQMPSVNITENDKEYNIDLAVPGLDKKDIKIELDNGILTVSAEKEEEKKEDKTNYRRCEFSYSRFSRSFDLPENAYPDKIDAKYENGVLKLMIPKKETSSGDQKKEIKVS